MRGFVRISAATALAALALTACSFEGGVSTHSVKPEELEKQVTQSLTQQVGQAPKKVECPDELPGREGAHTRCTLTAPDDTRIGVTVTAGSMKDDNTVDLDIQVDDEPM